MTDGLSEAESDLLDQALHRLGDRLEADELYRAYYAGDHRLNFATEKFRTTFGALFSAFADNLTPAVVDALADRLQITGWGVQGSPEGEASHESNEKHAQELWDRNQMDRRAGEVHTEAIRQGMAYVLVWQDTQGKAVLWPQRSDMVCVEYDPETPGKVLIAVKAWKHGGKADGSDALIRVNAYLPDRLVKLVTRSAAEQAAKADNLIPWQVNGEAWPLAHDMGRVPMVPFANNAAVGQYGVSELRDVLPLQDVLNKTVADMMVAMEFVAMPQRWATGVEIPTDPETGKPVPEWRPSVERLWTTLATDARFGEFPQANLTQFLQVQDNFRAEVARVSATPFHYLMLNMGEFPSGEAMKTAEQRFLAKVRDRMGGFGSSWSEVMAMAMALESARDVTLEPDWQDPAPKSELEHASALKVKSDLGVPQPVLWKELGYTDQEVEDMEAKAAERRTTLADSMAQALNAGV